MKASDDIHAAKDGGAGSALLVLILLSLVNLLNYFDRMLIVVVSQPLRLEFGLTDTQYGILTGPAFVLVYVISNLIFGWASDRWDRRTIIAGVLAAWSMMTALCGMAHSFATLAFARAGVGVGEGGSNPACMSLLSDYYPAHRRTFVLSLFGAGGMAGLLLSFVAGGWIASEYGWRTLFFVAAIPGVLLSILAALLVRDPRQRARIAADRPDYARALRDLGGNAPLIWVSIAGAVGTFGTLGMVVWLPQFFIRDYGLTVAQVGLFFGPTGTFGLLCGMLLGGWIGNSMSKTSLARPLLICVANMIIMAPLYLIVLWVPSLPLALLATFAAMTAGGMAAPVIQAAVQNVTAAEARATATGLFNVIVGVIGQGLLPLSVGIISDALMPWSGDASLRWALTIATAYLVVSGLMFIHAWRLTERRLAGTTRPADLFR